MSGYRESDVGTKADLVERESLKNTIRFVIALVLTIMIGYALSYIPDTLDLATIQTTYNIDISKFYAEKSEILQYVVCSIAFPVIFLMLKFFSLNWVDRLYMNLKPSMIRTCHMASPYFVASAFLVTLMMNPIYLPMIAPYYNEQEVFRPWLIRLFAMVLLIGGLLFYSSIDRKIERVNLRKSRLAEYSYYGLGAIIILTFGYYFLTDSYYLGLAISPNGVEESSHHFNAYFYPVYKVYYGQTPLVDFNTLYGYYPYFLAPFLALLGGATMQNFSVIIAIIVVITLGGLFYILDQTVRNKLTVLLTLLAILYFSVINSAYIGPSIYYLQYFPHRLISPVLTLVLSCAYLSSHHKKAVRLMGNIQTTLALLWNTETGLVCLLGWAAFQIYLETIEYAFKDKALYRKSLIILIRTAISLLLAVSLLMVVTFLRSGQFAWADLLYGPGIFYGSGFYCCRCHWFTPGFSWL
jgi:hypothetical protein